MKKLFTLVVVVLMVVGAKAQTEIVVGPKVREPGIKSMVIKLNCGLIT